MPGDELLPDAPFLTSWDTEVDCPPSKVWPWLVQMGYGRAGWYIDAWWDKAINEFFWPKVVSEEHRAEHFQTIEHVDEDLQHLALGDVIPDGPAGSAWFTVEILEPDRALVLKSDRHIELMTPPRLQSSPVATHGAFTWAFLLEALPAERSRLTIRTRATLTPKLVAGVFVPFLKVVDRVFVKQMLRGIKRRAEATSPLGQR